MYQRIILVSLCVAVLSLFMSLMSVLIHYFYLHSTYQSIVAEEQTKVLAEIQELTIKEAIEKGYGPQIGLLLKPQERTNLSPIKRVEQIRKIEVAAWLSAAAAILVIFILFFVYWLVKKRVIYSFKKDVSGLLVQVNGFVTSVQAKDQAAVLGFLPLLLEVFGYRTAGQWLKEVLVKAETSEDLSDSSSENP